MADAQRNGNSSHSLEMANSNQELVSRGRARRWKWLGLGIAAAVTIAILTTVLVLVLKPDPDEPKGEQLTLEDILSRRFAPRQFNATWISDTELFFDKDTSGYEPVVFDISSKLSKSPFSDSVKLEYQTFQTELSADKKYALESFSYRALYRHSYLAYYNIIDVATGKKSPILIPGRSEPVFVQLAEWGPQGSALAVVVGNDIYYQKDALSPLVRVTTTGVHDTVYNGVPDWVYEEEVLSSKKALWFSPDGALLAYATYNDSRVPVMTLPYYGRPGDLTFQYTRAVNIRYPKPGTNNPDVTLSVFDPSTGVRVTVEPPPSIKAGPHEPVLAVTHWVPDAPAPRLLTVWMNRVQDHAVVELVTVSAGAISRVTLADLQQPKGWIELFEEGVTSLSARARGRVLLPLSHPVGTDSFRHIALFHPNQDGSYSRTSLTDGAYVVTSILSWDSDNGYVYFVSTAEGDPKRALVQRVKDDPVGAPHKPECLSCNVSDCLYATAALSKNNSYIALTCSGPGVPFTAIYSTGTGKTPQKLMDWETNESIREALAPMALPTRKSIEVDLPGGFKAQVMLWIPPGADLSGKTKYPMLVDVYGGPNSFRVSERFAMDWGTFLSANKSVIYAAIDGRGSANKGDNTIFSIYHRFGTYEVEDQINVTRKLQQDLKYIDTSKTAIWGWSYGGYASAMALAMDTENVFKCGMSVAPVTDWIYYDSIYTERYMGLPTEKDNRFGYTRAQLTNKVENFKNKFFMLVHGTLDDNVHYQQSMMLSRALEENDILFRQQSYPDEEHGINYLQPHLYHTLQNFLMECYQSV